VFRPFLSLVVAGVASAVGLSVLLIAAQGHAYGIGSASPDPVSDVLMLVGVLVVGVAAGSLVVHWLGALVVGAIHFLLGGIAVLIPVPGFLSGTYSPTWEITGMLRDLSQPLGEGSTIYFFSGTALVLGAFLIGAALAARSRWESPPIPRATVVTAGIVGAVVLLVALTLLATVGNDFINGLIVRLQYGFPGAMTIAGAAVLAGVGGLTLRWSSAGAVAVGAAALLFGAAAIVAAAALPLPLASTRVLAYGLLPAIGASLVAAGLAAAVRRPSVPVETAAL
jgi:hypothetical protein